MLKSVERARPLAGCKHVIYFDVYPEEGEDIAEIRAALASLGCEFADSDPVYIRAFTRDNLPRCLRSRSLRLAVVEEADPLRVERN